MQAVYFCRQKNYSKWVPQEIQHTMLHLSLFLIMLTREQQIVETFQGAKIPEILCINKIPKYHSLMTLFSFTLIYLVSSLTLVERKISSNEYTEEPILQEFLCSFVLDGKDTTITLAKTAIFLIPVLSSKKAKIYHFTYKQVCIL